MMHQMLLSLILGLWLSPGAQPRTFSYEGTVMTDDKKPLPDCIVRAEGSAVHARSNAEGYFKLVLPDSCANLIAYHPETGEQRQEGVCAGKKITFRFAPPKPVRAREERDAYYLMGPPPAQMKLITTPAVPFPSGVPAGRPFGEPSYMNTEEYAHTQENRFRRAQDEPLSTFSIDVDAASYSNLRRFLKNGQMPPADAVRIEEMINYFDYDYPGPKEAAPFAVHTELAECPWNPAHHLLAVGIQGKRLELEALPPSNLVFLIDVSGSMDWPNKLPLLQSSFRLLTDQLRPADRVAIVVYAGAAGLVLPATPGSDKKTILSAIDQLKAGGSTAGGDGIKLAYRIAREQFMPGGNNRVILATDGDFNIGVSSEGDLVRLIEKERESGVFLTVLGFGMGNYKDNKMQQLADKGNGNHYYIDDIEEAKKVLVREFGGTMFAIAKDVKIQVEFNPAKVQGYRLVGYENRLLNKEDFNDDRKDAGELGAGHTVTALYEIIPPGVENSWLGKTDPLKYQSAPVQEKGRIPEEWLTIKLRYKDPQGTQSKLVEKVVSGNVKDWASANANFQWASAVAEFGMLLRNSDFKGSATLEHCYRIAKTAAARTADPYGYRAECIRLIDTALGLGVTKNALEANKH